MKKNKMKNLFSAFLMAAILASCSSRAEEPESTGEGAAGPESTFSVIQNDTIWNTVDRMPHFSGGDSALLSYILKNTRYPEQARKAGAEGKCFVRFCVTAEGNVEYTSILKGVTPELDAEAFRVVASLPKFEHSAVKNGRPVAVWYVVPIQFKLN